LVKHKTVIEARHPPFRQTAVSGCGSFSVALLSVHSYNVFERWLGGSFAKLGFSVGLSGFAIVPPNALAK
jgi:hypothetical protein